MLNSDSPEDFHSDVDFFLHFFVLFPHHIDLICQICQLYLLLATNSFYSCLYVQSIPLLGNVLRTCFLIIPRLFIVDFNIVTATPSHFHSAIHPNTLSLCSSYRMHILPQNYYKPLSKHKICYILLSINFTYYNMLNLNVWII